ncbi:OVARIAN TUMOR DOMAIN-containing deubiquitinating enzyme 3-like isoform X2 [Rosa rugosa]|uniref:OVARIAN TUMOR DOMAIN-containing deubiquitinating enzyme 3-like isoform X2 n=1 Tax=Rosa rugosa TaxID=74645 RepID=UPI002B41420A|nr:OVARIAN TUMOR DOMAIN-containing deubiquitinating enzyme 3-like isoform X2 [Rosa rugosa]
MAPKFSNQAVLEQLKNGFAQFELVSYPLLSISTSISQANFPASLGDYSHRFFAGTGLGGGSKEFRKAEIYTVHEVKKDGRCLFRALAKGILAANTGSLPDLTKREEQKRAGELLEDVNDVICENTKLPKYEAARKAINAALFKGGFHSYCDRIREPDFWGGESELLVLSQLLKQPIIVYKRADEHTNGGGGSAFIPIEEYGTEFKPKKAVRLLLIHLSDRNHYDLLV